MDTLCFWDLSPLEAIKQLSVRREWNEFGGLGAVNEGDSTVVLALHPGMDL